MTWTEPKTDWALGDLVSQNDLNDIGANLLALKEPPTAHFEADQSSDYTTTSTTFVDVDATSGNFNLSIETSGGDVLVGFSSSVRLLTSTSDDYLWLNLMVDGGDVAADDGVIVYSPSNNDVAAISFTYLVTGLNAGTHAFKLRWRVNSGRTGILYAGAGTSNLNVHPQFWVREVS